MIRTLCALIFLVSCAGTGSRGTSAAPWSAVVLDRLCDLDARELGGSEPVLVVEETVPVMNFVALLVASEVAVTPESASHALDLEARARAAFTAEEIILPGNVCRFEKTGKASSFPEQILVELSSPVVNPYGGATGSFARVSLGGRAGATWFWIGLSQSNAKWSVTNVVKLQIHDG